MRRFLIFLVLLAFGGPLAAQTSQGFITDTNCSTAGNSAVVGEVCVFINGTTADMVRLRDAVTVGWTGDLTCTSAHVSLSCSDGVQTCATAGEVLVGFGRKHAAMCNLIIELRRLVKARELREAQGGVTPPTEPDIGGGDTG